MNPEGHAASDRWIGQADAGDWDALVEDLLLHHYDPSYAKAWVRNYSEGPSGGLIEVEVRSLSLLETHPGATHAVSGAKAFT